MDNSENIFEVQKKLFKEIQKNIPSRYALVGVISDVLGIGMDSAHRRISGKKLLNVKETYMLCKHF